MIELVRLTFKEWSDDNAPRLAAALSYYTIFSLAPLLIVVIAVIGMVYSREAIQSQILDQVGRLIGQEGEDFVLSMITTAAYANTGVIATVIGIATVLIGALGVFNELQNSLNTIWDVKLKPVKNLGESIKRLVLSRLLSFAMVLSIGFLLLVSMVITAAIAAIEKWLSGQITWIGPGVQVLNLVVSLLITTLLFALLYKFIPDAVVSWRDVIVGGLVTSILFNLGKYVIGIYLGTSQVGTTFGAAGVLAITLIWIYYSAQIVFLGAEFTQVYANRYGSKIKPNQNAVSLDVEDRAKQGLSAS